MLRRCVLLTLTLTVPTHSLSEGRVGNGGEYITHEENPWFIGSQPVTYCVMEPQDFSLSLTEAHSFVEGALAEWSSTINALRPRSLTSDFGSLAGETITTEFRYEPCRDSTELVFYFGNDDPRVTSVIGNFSDNLVAFAHRDQYDPTTGRAKGFIWIAPDRGPRVYGGPKWRDTDFWQQPDSVTRNPLWWVLRHEIGHIYAIPHGEGIDSVMSAGVPAKILINPGRLHVHRPSVAYQAQNWLYLDRKMCTTVEERSARFRQFMNWPAALGDVFEICFERIEHSSEFASVKISFHDEAGLSVASLPEEWNVYLPHLAGTWSYSLISGHYISQRFGHDYYERFNFIPKSTFQAGVYNFGPLRTRVVPMNFLGDDFELMFQREDMFELGYLDSRFPGEVSP